jgi:hypothetical protein
VHLFILEKKIMEHAPGGLVICLGAQHILCFYSKIEYILKEVLKAYQISTEPPIDFKTLVPKICGYVSDNLDMLNEMPVGHQWHELVCGEEGKFIVADTCFCEVMDKCAKSVVESLGAERMESVNAKKAVMCFEAVLSVICKSEFKHPPKCSICDQSTSSVLEA